MKKEEVVKILNKFRNLDDDWNGFGCAKPKEKSIDAALSYIDQFEDDCDFPSPTLHADGNVVLYKNGKISVPKRYAKFFRHVDVIGSYTLDIEFDDDHMGWCLHTDTEGTVTNFLNETSCPDVFKFLGLVKKDKVK